MKTPYWLKNLPNRARGIRQEFCHFAGLGTLAQLSAVHIAADGTRTEFGVVSRRMVTNAGVAFLASAFTNTVEPETLNQHDSGTGVTAEAATQTALVTATGGARVAGTQSTPGSTNIYRSVATILYTSTLAITEHGIFTAASAGTMFDRSLFAAINVVNGDSIQFTHETTFPSGG